MREEVKDFIRYMNYEDNLVVNDVLNEFIWWYENERNKIQCMG